MLLWAALVVTLSLVEVRGQRNEAEAEVSRATFKKLCEMPEFQEAMARDAAMEPAAVVYEVMTERLERLEVKIKELETRLDDTPTRMEMQIVAAALRAELIDHVDNKVSMLSGELETNVEKILSNLFADLSHLTELTSKINQSDLFLEAPTTTEPPTTTPEPWRDCAYLANVPINGERSQSGVHILHLNGVDMEAYCEFVDDSAGRQGWLVVQRRVDGVVDFYRGWAEYKTGFGDLMASFYLGNDALHFLTSNRDYLLKINLVDAYSDNGSAEYQNFTVASEDEGYMLGYESYLGGTIGDGLKTSRGRKFSTKDVDQDSSLLYSCSKLHQGAFWYDKCGSANLNGQYSRPGYSNSFNWQNIIWYPWKRNLAPMTKVEMKLLLE